MNFSFSCAATLMIEVEEEEERKEKEDRNESLKAGKKRSIFIEGTWAFELAYRSSQSNSSLLLAEQEHIWETDVSSFNFLVYNYPSF